MKTVKTLACLSFAMLFVALFTLGLHLPARAEANLESTQQRPQAALSGWSYRRPITVSNGTEAALTNFQVKVTLSASNFNFAQAQSDGRDLRFTDSDATTLLNYWIEHYDSTGQTATLWVKVPSIPAGIGSKTIYLFFGNAVAAAASNGNATFEFFDDFELAATGYYTLSAATTVLSGNHQDWETSAIHTMSVVEMNQGGYQYWSYYGLEGGYGNIGRAYSNDLVNWTKDNNNSGTGLLPAGDYARWPQVITQAGTLYLVYNYGYPNNPAIALRTSPDGINFSAAEILVPDISNHAIGNPDIFFNQNDNQFYLYWFESFNNVYTIKMRHAATAAGLASAADTILLTQTGILAAPDMMFYDGTYFLATEKLDGPGSTWRTHIYTSMSPTGPFTPLPSNPVLGNDDACFFQHVFGTTMHAWYCKRTGSTWTLEHRTADLAAGRPQIPYLNATKWSPGGIETWSAQTGIQQDGTTGIVAQLVADPNRSGSQILKSSYTGTDYIVEVSLRLLSGRVLGLGARVTDQDHLYSANLYDDLNDGNNLYLYQWNPGAFPVGSTPVGTINSNTWYKLSIATHGTNFNISLEGTPRITVTNSTFASGFVSLLGEAGTTAQYDDLRVRKYASSEPVTGVGGLEGPNAVTMQGLSARATTQSPESGAWLIGLFICAGIVLLLARLTASKNTVH